MKFSVLLPTRNRLELLRYAIQSVLDQDHADWEIIVSDNDSDEDIRGFVDALEDPRITYHRTDKFLPVTENWNRALELSTGEYVIMLGDDDCLLKGCLSAAKKLLEDHQRPGLMYAEAVQFQYPGVVPGQDSAFIQFGYCEFLESRTAPFFLDPFKAIDVVRKSMKFQIAFSYNMQHSFISRTAIDLVKGYGDFFQSPYPDYYSTNALFVAVERILVCPWPLVAIGISPKSFGFYYLNDREVDGTQFLKNLADKGIVDRVKHVLLPGTNMNTSWLLAMETLKNNCGTSFDLSVSYWRYRYMQFRHLYSIRRSRREFLGHLYKFGSPVECIFWSMVVIPFAFALRFLPRRNQSKWEVGLLNLIHQSHPHFDPRRQGVPYKNILDLHRNMESGAPSSAS